MTSADWFLVAIMAWLVTWAALEYAVAQRRRKRDKYADLNEDR